MGRVVFWVFFFLFIPLAAFGSFKVTGIYLSPAILPTELRDLPPVFAWQGAPKETATFSYVLCFDANQNGRCDVSDRIIPLPEALSGSKDVSRNRRPSYLWFSASESAFLVPKEVLEEEGWGPVIAPERYLLCVTARDVNGKVLAEDCGAFKRLEKLRADTIFLVTKDYLENPTPEQFYHDLDALMPPGLKEDGVKCYLYLLRPGEEPEKYEVEVELRGSTSRTYPKKQFNVEFDDDVSLFGMRESDEYILNGSWFDRTFMRDELAFRLAEALGRFGVKQHFVELFINGEYFGLYIFKEKINKDRIEAFTKERHAEKPVFPLFGDKRKGETKRAYADRFILKTSLYKFYKPERLGLLTAPSLLPEDWNRRARNIVKGSWLGLPIWRWVYPSRKKVSILRETAVVRYLGAMWREAARGGERLSNFLDYESAADFAILQEVSLNPDNYVASVYIYRPRREKVRFVGWDFDGAFGNVAAKPDAVTGWAASVCPVLFKTLFADEDFRKDFRAHYEDLRGKNLEQDRYDDFLSEDNLNREWFSYNEKETIPKFYTEKTRGKITREVLEDNFSRWPIDDDAYKQYYEQYTTNYTKDEREELLKRRIKISSWEEEVEFFKNWLFNRLNFLDNELSKEKIDWPCQ